MIRKPRRRAVVCSSSAQEWAGLSVDNSQQSSFAKIYKNNAVVHWAADCGKRSWEMKERIGQLTVYSL